MLNEPMKGIQNLCACVLLLPPPLAGIDREHGKCAHRNLLCIYKLSLALLAMSLLLPVMAYAQGYPPFYGPGWSVQCLSTGSSNGVTWNSQQAIAPPSGYVGGYSCNGYPRLSGISGTITPVLVWTPMAPGQMPPKGMVYVQVESVAYTAGLDGQPVYVSDGFTEDTPRPYSNGGEECTGTHEYGIQIDGTKTTIPLAPITVASEGSDIAFDEAAIRASIVGLSKSIRITRPENTYVAYDILGNLLPGFIKPDHYDLTSPYTLHSGAWTGFGDSRFNDGAGYISPTEDYHAVFWGNPWEPNSQDYLYAKPPAQVAPYIDRIFNWSDSSSGCSTSSSYSNANDMPVPDFGPTRPVNFYPFTTVSNGVGKGLLYQDPIAQILNAPAPTTSEVTWNLNDIDTLTSTDTYGFDDTATFNTTFHVSKEPIPGAPPHRPADAWEDPWHLDSSVGFGITPVGARQLTSQYSLITESVPVSLGFSVNCAYFSASVGGTYNLNAVAVNPLNVTALASQVPGYEFVVYSRPVEEVTFQDYKHYEAAGRHILGINPVTGAEYPHRVKEITPTGAMEAVVVVFNTYDPLEPLIQYNPPLSYSTEIENFQDDPGSAPNLQAIDTANDWAGTIPPGGP